MKYLSNDMAEYPTRTCGPCPMRARFEPEHSQHLDCSFYSKNSVPEPKISFNDQSGVSHELGVPSTDIKPNLNNEEYKGGIPPCKETVTFPRCRPAVTVEEMHALAGRKHPGKEPEPNDVPQSVHRPEPEGAQPCYLPQPGDNFPSLIAKSMEPVGPWATGRVDWGPLSGLTGTRPVVDKYSITRYSEGEWRGHNKSVLDDSNGNNHKAGLIEWNGMQCLEQSQADTDKNQEDNTKRLNQRETEIHRWKCELEHGIQGATEEIALLEVQRHRLKKAAAVLTLPESISGECIMLRTTRLDSELVRDDVEDELVKESALCAEIRDIFSRTLSDIEKQLEENKTAKERLEYDWSDKKVAHEIDTLNMTLNNKSTTIMFKPGAVCFPEEQSTPEYWEYFTKETLLGAETTRQRSVTLRGTLDAILNNASRDLRTQADRVELALSKRIACTQEALNRMENELKRTLRKLVDIENLIEHLKDAIHRMDVPMKKVQTRLDNRLKRPRVENCRDVPHYGLIEEVKSIGESVAALTAQLNQAEISRNDLMKIRTDLELEIMLKKRTLEIDDFRVKKVRSYYPSATALSGY